MCLISRFILTTMALIFATIHCTVAPAAAAPLDTASEVSTIQDFDVKLLRNLASSVKTDAHGAIGENASAFDQVQLQNQSSFVVLDAIAERNLAQVDKALRILEYGFAHQRTDGSFQYDDARPGRARIGAAPVPLTIDASAAFFYYDLGLTLTLLDQSGWFKTDPQVAQYRARAESLKEPAEKGLSWLLSQEDTLRSDHLASNRIFGYAMSYYLTGKALRRQDAADVGLAFLRSAMKQQTADGTFPENGGFDSSYQGVSIYHAEVLYLALDEHAALRHSLWQSIHRGVIKELTAVASDGSIQTEGNTRIHQHGETAFDRIKEVDGRSVTLALQYYARLSEDEGVQRQADAVARRYYLLIG